MNFSGVVFNMYDLRITEPHKNGKKPYQIGLAKITLRETTSPPDKMEERRRQSTVTKIKSKCAAWITRE